MLLSDLKILYLFSELSHVSSDDFHLRTAGAPSGSQMGGQTEVASADLSG